MAKLTSEQKAMKIHRRSYTGRPVCGAYIALEGRERATKVTWRGVTCKNCLKQKK